MDDNQSGISAATEKEAALPTSTTTENNTAQELASSQEAEQAETGIEAAQNKSPVVANEVEVKPERFAHHNPLRRLSDTVQHFVMDDLRNPGHSKANINQKEMEPPPAVTDHPEDSQVDTSEDTSFPSGAKQTSYWTFGVKDLTVPTVTITRDAAFAMIEEVLAHPHEETAWGLYGYRNVHTDAITVLGILRPQNGDANRQYVTAHFGNDNYVQELGWLEAHYRFLLQEGKAPKDTAFEFLFKGHSHHTLGYKHYSGTDYGSLMDAVHMGMPVALGPLANISINPTIFNQVEYEGDLKTVFHAEKDVTFTYYYYSRRLAQQGIRNPVTVHPKFVWKGPIELPTMPWVMVKPDLYRNQMELLAAYECQVQQVWVKRGSLPLKIQFLLSKPYWSKLVVITTNYDYPNSVATCEIMDPNDRKNVFISPLLPRFARRNFYEVAAVHEEQLLV